jgi:hypothetical protein
MRAIVLCIGLAASAPALAKDRCILPTPDGGDAPSPANVEGSIAVSGTTLKIRRVGTATPPLVVNLGSDSRIFTVYGGSVSRSELKIGQVVRVWFENCREASGGIQVAVLQLASTKPGEGFE